MTKACTNITKQHSFKESVQQYFILSARFHYCRWYVQCRDFARGAMSHPYIKLDPQVMFPTKISDSTKSVAPLRDEAIQTKLIF